MRTVKFRAWDGHSIIKSDDWPNLSGFFGTRSQSEILMQFTSLKDKNGKEIYEGDIVQVDWGNMAEEYIIENKYDKPFVMEFRNYEYPPFSRYLPMPKDVEIIGNIWENPELLNLH